MNSYDDIQIEDVYADLPDDADECLRMLARHGIDPSQPATSDEPEQPDDRYFTGDCGDADPDYTHPDRNLDRDLDPDDHL